MNPIANKAGSGKAVRNIVSSGARGSMAVSGFNLDSSQTISSYGLGAKSNLRLQGTHSGIAIRGPSNSTTTNLVINGPNRFENKRCITTADATKARQRMAGNQDLSYQRIELNSG